MALQTSFGIVYLDAEMTISGNHLYTWGSWLTRSICKDSAKHTVYSRKSRARDDIRNSLPSMHIEEYFLLRTNSWVYDLRRRLETTSEVLADIMSARAVFLWYIAAIRGFRGYGERTVRWYIKGASNYQHILLRDPKGRKRDTENREQITKHRVEFQIVVIGKYSAKLLTNMYLTILPSHIPSHASVHASDPPNHRSHLPRVSRQYASPLNTTKLNLLYQLEKKITPNWRNRTADISVIEIHYSRAP